MPATSSPRVLIVAEHASARFGGEAALPLHYYEGLKRRGADVWLLVHDRTKEELLSRFPADDRILFVADSAIDRFLWRAGALLPDRLSTFTTGFLMRIRTQLAQRKRIKTLIADGAIDLIHQPMPVSPREPSLLFSLPVPVVIGPMNGGMSFPAGFKDVDGSLVRAFVAAGRWSAAAINRVLPGKRQACALLVANERTRAALPCKGKRVIEMVENGVDFELWHDRERPTRPRGDATRFVFLGRLVDWKAVDLLLAAFADAAARAPMSLTILGDGPERGKLEAIAQAHDMLSDTLETGKVWFAGWRPQVECATLLAQHDALVLPSLYECGGAVVLEAMAMRLPVIATKWGGPADYLDPTCGILVEPNTRETFVAGLTEGLVRLALSPELRTAMGQAGQDRVKEHFDWRIKIERMIKIYRDIVAQGVRPKAPAPYAAASSRPM